MNTVSLKLCKELYKLSGWEMENGDTYYKKYSLTKWATPIPRGVHTLSGELEWECPAYSLGYLLRKLPGHIAITSTNWDNIHTEKPEGQELDYQAVACYQSNIKRLLVQQTADTPEDAACKLAIELWKAKVLK